MATSPLPAAPSPFAPVDQRPGSLTVAVTAVPSLAEAERAVAALGSALIIFVVLLRGAKLLLARPATFRALWPSTVLGAAAASGSIRWDGTRTLEPRIPLLVVAVWGLAAGR